MKRRPGLSLSSTLVLALAFAIPSQAGDSKRSSVGSVAPAAEQVTPLDVGERAPSVVLRDVAGAQVSLGDFVGREPVALVFFRGGW